jgi:hypothetical protein
VPRTKKAAARAFLARGSCFFHLQLIAPTLSPRGNLAVLTAYTTFHFISAVGLYHFYQPSRDSTAPASGTKVIPSPLPSGKSWMAAPCVEQSSNARDGIEVVDLTGLD